MFSGFAPYPRSHKAKQGYYQWKPRILINENRRFILGWIETACSSEQLAAFLYWEHWCFQTKSRDKVFSQAVKQSDSVCQNFKCTFLSPD